MEVGMKVCRIVGRERLVNLAIMAAWVAATVVVSQVPLFAQDVFGSGLGRLLTYAQGWFLSFAALGILATVAGLILSQREVLATGVTVFGLCILGLATPRIMEMLQGLF